MNRRQIEEFRNLLTEDEGITPYHGNPKRSDVIPPERRKFIAWDGEGRNLHGPNKPQSYVLFGASTGNYIAGENHIHTFELLRFIVSVGRENPGAFHIGFAFNYDVNMIVQSLHRRSKERIHKEGHCILRTKQGEKFRLEFRPGKWFVVTQYEEGYDAETNRHKRTTVKIYDIFSFFAKSFIKAYEEMVGPIPDIVHEGKSKRAKFDTMEPEYILRYWQAEIVLLVELAESLRRNLYGANFRIRQWHGPGALASHVLRLHNVDRFMAPSPEPVRIASKYAYAGGRFEVFKLGRTIGPIYSVDINSAYPYGISRLPNLRNGEWTRIIEPGRRANWSAFSIFRIRYRIPDRRGLFQRTPGPIFHRDKMGNISYPENVETWVWYPEVRALVENYPSDSYKILEAWEYRGGYSDMPFTWLPDMYERRREWKSAGIPSQLALKLAMNSIYGKMAQRVGWDTEKYAPPKWHQLEWAGWVTSLTRAMLLDVMLKAGNDNVIAVETDGVYLTVSPESLGINRSSKLGAFSVVVYDEILYVQSGLAWLRKGDEWECKRRGLDPDTFSLQHCQEYLQSLKPKSAWSPFIGRTTRFITLGTALKSKAPEYVRHCVWETKEREINAGTEGKRVHIHAFCQACQDGKTAYDTGHDTIVRSLAIVDPQSQPHDLPWDADNPPDWREAKENTWEEIE